MPIVPSNIVLNYSIANSPGNAHFQNDPNFSLGGFISTAQWLGGSMNDLFNDLTGDENAAFQVDYRCVFVQNTHSTLTWLNPVLWLASEVANAAIIDLGADPTPASLIGSATHQSVSISAPVMTPSGVTFSHPGSAQTGIPLGSLPPGFCVAFWVRRTATNSPALNNDGCTISLNGSTVQ